MSDMRDLPQRELEVLRRMLETEQKLTRDYGEHIARLESQRDELASALATRDAQLAEAVEHIKWMLPVESGEIGADDEESCIDSDARKFLSRISAGKPDPRLALTAKDLDVFRKYLRLPDNVHTANSTGALMEAEYRERRARRVDSIIAALEPAKQDITEKAKALYISHTANDPIVHCNRFSSWDELSDATKQQWIDKAALEPADSTKETE